MNRLESSERDPCPAEQQGNEISVLKQLDSQMENDKT